MMYRIPTKQADYLQCSLQPMPLHACKPFRSRLSVCKPQCDVVSNSHGTNRVAIPEDERNEVMLFGVIKYRLDTFWSRDFKTAGGESTRRHGALYAQRLGSRISSKSIRA